MSALAVALVLLQTTAATPSPAPSPTPTPRPVSAGPRTLQDVARERRLRAGAKGKGSLGTLTVAPSTVSPAPAATPDASVPADAAPEPTPEPDPGGSTASVRVASVSNDGIVDGVGAVRVNGTVRNAGSRNACNVLVTVKILDSRGLYLSSGQASPDVAVIPPGDVVSFHALVQAPPGVRGARMSPDRKDATEGSTTMGGDWKILGGTEATVASASEDCGR